MNFISFAFLVLYLVALAVRWLDLGKGQQLNALRIAGLLALSWLFYAWHVPWYIFLIIASTLIVYSAGLLLAAVAPTQQRQRRWILAGSVFSNLGMLAWFKYSGLLVLTVNDISGSGLTVPEILLPIGISFYTFQALSYTIDVYRGKIAAETSFIRLACYIAFFPQLVAGPIVRAADFLYQFDRRRRPHWRIFTFGAYLILRGLFLKLVVADNLGAIIDPHWETAAGDSQGPLALAMLVFFACQLLCDFAGYVDIARGVSYQLGFRLPINFNAPYIATSFSEFWHRWHITLSLWMRDYLYIPLGGNRVNGVRVYFNLWLVMLLSGLWHGANWTFLAWGGVLGLALVIERLGGMNRPQKSLLATLGWFCVVQLVWVLSMGLFRSANIQQAQAIMSNALAGLLALPVEGLALQELSGLITLGWWLTVPVWLLHARAWLAEHSKAGPPRAFEQAIYAGFMLAALLMLYASGDEFIYFQF